MKDIRNLVLAILCLSVSPQLFGQHRKLEKLEMYYDQGQYEVLYRKSKRYMHKPEFDHSPAPAFYKALATYRMALRGNPKFTHERSMEDYQAFLQQKPSSDFMSAHGGEILDYKHGLMRYATAMSELDKAKKARAILADINRLFNEDVQYADIIKEPVDPKKPGKAEKGSKGNSAKDLRTEIIDYSKKFIGTPYVWGGESPNGFDCSGFTQYVMSNHGVVIPRIAGDQYHYGDPIPLKKAQKGDLVFFGSGKKVTHVGIVVSEPGEQLSMIHASSSRGIMISNIENSTYWKPKLLFAAAVVTE